VLPEVKIGKWEGLEAEIPDVSVGGEDISRELDVIRERNSVVLDKNEGEAAASGDVVTVNYCELGEDGVVLAGSERQDFTFTIGSRHNIYEFDDEITGMKKDETKDFSKTYPIDHKDYPGKTKKLKATLTALKVKKLPELDDDLAQDVDEKFKTLDDLKNSIRERLDKGLERKMKGIKVSRILEKIVENTPVEIPESMLRMELDSRFRNLARRFNTDVEGLYKIMGNSPEGPQSIIENWKPDAIKALHSRLIVETLIEDLKLEAEEGELEKEFERMAAESNADLEDVKKYYGDEEAKEYLKEEIKEQKFYDILFERNVIKTGEKLKLADFEANYGRLYE
jgi:trigger factor